MKETETGETLTRLATTPIGRDEGEFMAARLRDPLAELDADAVVRGRPALELAAKIAAALRDLAPGVAGPKFDLSGLDETSLTVLAEVLGEGEVSIFLAAPREAQAQESVLAGVWRVRETAPDGKVLRDYVEIGDVPALVRAAAFGETATSFDVGTPPEGAMNVMPVLAEIAARAATWRDGGRNHIISFSLLPMTPQDQEHLQAQLGRGPVHIVSRGYGRCRVLATGVRYVWAVQFFSASGEVVLDTVEIGDVPESARAAKEDFEDSSVRMLEIVEAYL